MRRVAFLVVFVVGVGACRSGPRKTCRVNDQCFVCPDDKAVAKCMADPTTSRCKWAPPSECR